MKLDKSIFWMLVLLFVVFGVNAQQKKIDTLNASIFYKKANNLLDKKEYKKSITYFNKALIEYTKAQDYKKEALCYRKLGENYEGLLDYDNALIFHKKSYNLKKEKLAFNQKSISASLSDLGRLSCNASHYKKAITFFEEALNITSQSHGKEHQNTGNIQNNIGVCYYNLGNLHKALKYLKKSLDIDIKTLEENHINIGYSYINIGLVYAELKQSDKAMEFYQNSLPYFIKNNSHRGLIGSYNNSGNILKGQGEWNKALEYYKKSLTLALNHFKDDVPLLSLIYMNIGNTYRMLENFDKGLFYLNKSLENYKFILDKNLDGIAKVYDNIGILYAEKKDYDTALIYHKKGLAIQKKLNNSNETAYSLQLLGELMYKCDKLDESLQYFIKGVKIMQKTYGANHLLTASFQYNIGIVNLKKGNYNLAIKHLDSATISNSKYRERNKNSLKPNHYFDHHLALKTNHKKALALQQKYLKTNNANHLNQGIELYKQSDDIIDYIRESLHNHQDKLVLAKQAKAIYTDAIAAYLLQYKTTKNKQDLIGAWHFTEKSKSNTLKDLLNDTNAKNFSELPNELLNFEKSIKSDLAYYQSLIVAEQSENTINTDKIKDYENALFTINQKKDSLTQILKNNYPKYYQLKHKTNPFSIKNIQEKINKKTTVLEFFTTDTTIYTFVISKKAVSIKTFKISNLKQKIEQFNTAIISENINTYKPIASILYQDLFSTLNKDIVGNELIIIPDGPLWHLNFDLLLTNNQEKHSNRELPYLLKQYAVAYSNSASLLFNPIKTDYNTSQTLKECLAFSYSNQNTNNENLNSDKAPVATTQKDLPGTRKELNIISNLIDGQYFYGENAIESTFKQNAKKYSILHLALHGEVDIENHQNSRLYFTTNKDALEDNILYNHELFALNIPADLVTLSACNTGIGKIANGEGLMSLGNAFQYAGAKSLLLSKWEVHDKTTPELMGYFYSNIKKGMTKSRALQKAKLKYLSKADAFYTNPYYWGSFYIIGNTDSINLNNSFNTIYYWITGLALCLLFFLWLKNKK